MEEFSHHTEDTMCTVHINIGCHHVDGREAGEKGVSIINPVVVPWSHCSTRTLVSIRFHSALDCGCGWARKQLSKGLATDSSHLIST
jgi:hypothetical protein